MFRTTCSTLPLPPTFLKNLVERVMLGNLIFGHLEERAHTDCTVESGMQRGTLGNFHEFHARQDGGASHRRERTRDSFVVAVLSLFLASGSYEVICKRKNKLNVG